MFLEQACLIAQAVILREVHIIPIGWLLTRLQQLLIEFDLPEAEQSDSNAWLWAGLIIASAAMVSLTHHVGFLYVWMLGLELRAGKWKLLPVNISPVVSEHRPGVQEGPQSKQVRQC